MSLKPTSPELLDAEENIDELLHEGRALRAAIREALYRAHILHDKNAVLTDAQLIAMLRQLGDLGLHARMG